MCWDLNSHYFDIIGDGHQPNNRGLYTHYKDSLLKRGMTIPQYKELGSSPHLPAGDPGDLGREVGPDTSHG